MPPTLHPLNRSDLAWIEPDCRLVVLARTIRAREPAAETTLEDSAVRNRMLTYGATIKFGAPELGMELIVSEIDKWAKAVKATGARVD